MKNKNTIIKIILVFITLGIFLYANATDVNVAIKGIKKEWENTLKVDFDKPMPDSWLSWEMKVFKDIKISWVTKDTAVANKINITIDKELKAWSTYNIFSVFWVEWSADFIVEEPLNAKIISTAPEAQWITKITLKDKKNIIVEFKNPITWTDFEFKLLEDLSVNEINSASWSMILKTTAIIEKNTDYILIWISLADNSNNTYILNESIFDFSIWADELVTNTTKEKTEETVNVILNSAWEDPLKVNIWTWLTTTALNQTGGVNVNIWNTVNWTWALWNIETVAVKARTTPDTGPETVILMILTLIINSIYFLTRKFSL